MRPGFEKWEQKNKNETQKKRRSQASAPFVKTAPKGEAHITGILQSIGTDLRFSDRLILNLGTTGASPLNIGQVGARTPQN